MIVYDLEILAAVPPRDGRREPGILYCEGWKDLKHMGVACLCAYDTRTRRYRVFCHDNLGEFADLAARDPSEVLAGFNSMPFDNQVLKGVGMPLPERRSYDLLREVWVGAGLSALWRGPSHAGYGLDALAKANGLPGKTGYGGDAPLNWQRHRYGGVIDYCLEDVRLTVELLRTVVVDGSLVDPKSGQRIQVRKPRAGAGEDAWPG